MADQAEEPLIGSRDESRLNPGEGGSADMELRSESNSLELNVQHPGRFVWLLTFSAGISGLLFGYDTGVISATLVSIGTSLSHRPLTTTDKSLITAITSLTALLISPTSGLLADRLGRKPVILLADLLFIVGAVIQALAPSVTIMVLGRALVGLAVGAASFVVPLYIAELAPARFRGRLVTLNVLFITLGQVAAYVVGWGFAEWGNGTGWRWMVGLGAVPAGLQCGIMVFMPETPRWLVKVGRPEEARDVLQNVFGSRAGAEFRTGMLVSEVLRGIWVEVREEEEAKRGRLRGKAARKESSCVPGLNDSWTELFHVPGNRRAVTIACLLQGLQQLCGFNSLMYFSATIFALLGFHSPTLTALVIALTNFSFTLLSLLLIDRLGRRLILLLSIPLMSLALLACALFFSFINLPPSLSSSFPAISSSTSLSQPSMTIPSLILLSLTLYVASYALGLGNVPWQQSELFPLSVRGLGSGIATATNWAANFLVGITFLPLCQGVGPSATFVGYAVVCAGGWVLVWCMYPETSGLSLEETGELLREGWGVRRARGRVEGGLRSRTVRTTS